jgi:serine/threonine-protein kinase RsbW
VIQILAYHQGCVPGARVRHSDGLALHIERAPLVSEQQPGPTYNGDLRPNEVEIRMLASGARLSSVRALAADVALREDFDLDAVSDLRLAVDEACATVLARARPEGTLVCRLLVTPRVVEISATAATDNGHPPPVDSMGWQMLRTLTDAAQCWTSESNGDRLIHVRIVKIRA